jgi:hypothetical protein
MTGAEPGEPFAAELRAEARWLYGAIFGGQPSHDIENAYVSAHSFFCRADNASPLVRTVVQRRLDVEAIELALRHRNPVLTRKCRMLVYLAESAPADYPRFVSTKPLPVLAWVLLAGAAAGAAIKLLKGRWLVWRHRLV